MIFPKDAKTPLDKVLFVLITLTILFCFYLIGVRVLSCFENTVINLL